MDLYYFNILMVFIYGFLINSSHLRYKNRCFLGVACIHLLCIHALRDPFVFLDTNNYLAVFNLVSTNNSFEELLNDKYTLFRFEPGYIIFNYIVSRISQSDYAIFVVSSFIIVLGYLYPVYRYSKSPFLSVLIILLYPLIFQQSFFVIRQHMACAICMFGLPFIEKRKFCLFLLILLIASSFHYSAVILFPLYFIYNLQLSRINLRFAILLFIAFFVLRYGISYVANTNSRYEGYVDGAGNFLVFGLFLITTFLFVKFVRHKFFLIENPKDRIVIVYNLYSLVISFALLGMSIGRLTNYFTYFLCIIIAFLYNELPRHLGFLVVLFFLLFVLYLNSKMVDFTYQSFL